MGGSGALLRTGRAPFLLSEPPFINSNVGCSTGLLAALSARCSPAYIPPLYLN